MRYHEINYNSGEACWKNIRPSLHVFPFLGGTSNIMENVIQLLRRWDKAVVLMLKKHWRMVNPPPFKCKTYQREFALALSNTLFYYWKNIPAPKKGEPVFAWTTIWFRNRDKRLTFRIGFQWKIAAYSLSRSRWCVLHLNFNFHPLEVISRWRDPQLQVGENYSDLTKWRWMIL